MIKKLILIQLYIVLTITAAIAQDANKALEYYNAGEYEKAAAEFEKALPVYEKQYGSKDTMQYALVVFYSALSFEYIELYNKAEDYYLKVKNIYESLNATHSATYATCLNSLAGLYKNTGRSKKSELIYLKALDIRKSIFGEDSHIYAISQNDLGLLYFSEGEYDKAESLFVSALEIIRKKHEGDYTSYINFLTNLTELYRTTGKYDKAEPIYKEGIEIIKKNLGEDNPLYSTFLSNLAELYRIIGKFDKAEPLYNEAIDLDKKNYGENSEKYATDINNLALLFENTEKFDKAETLLLQVVQIFKQLKGEDNVAYSTALGNLAQLYVDIGKYEMAEQLCLQVVKINKKIVGENNVDFASDISNLANLYQKMGKTEKAEPLYLQALKIIKNAKGEEHFSSAMIYNNLAELYRLTGKYEKAEEVYLTALKIEEKNFGEETSNYAMVIGNLAELYRNTGRYNLAEPLYMMAINLTKKIFGDENTKYANLLNCLALFYEEIGNYPKAVPLIRRSSEIIKNIFGENHYEYANSLISLGGLYKYVFDYDTAEQLYLKAIQIEKNTIGEEHSDYALAINNLANLYLSTGKYDKAEPLLLQAIKIKKKNLGEEHPDYAYSINNLALLYQYTNKFEKAELLYEQSLKIFKKVYGSEHSSYSMTLNNLILLYINGDKFNKAEPLIHEAMISNRSQKDKQSIFLSEAEMEIYIYFMTISNYVYESTFLNQITLKPSLSEEVYNIELLTKGMLLNSNLKMRSDILSSNDTSLINLYNRWISVKTYLANQYMISADKRSPDMEQLEVNANYMEKELLKTSKEFSGSKQQEDAIWTDIKSSLKEKEASVEFASFNYYDGKRWTDSVYYIALVLKKDDKYPKMIYLCEEKQLDSVFNFTKGNDRAKADQLYASRGIKVKDDGATNKTYSKLYNLIWKPISESLKEVETIYFSPTGLLNKISFAAIANPDSVYLSDKYRLVQLSSTAEILRLKQKNVQISVSDTAIIYGGINYEKMKQPGLKADSNEIVAYNRGPKIDVDSTRGSSWNYLKGTYKEANYIDSLFRKNNISSTFYSDSSATETFFKNMSGKSPQVIHVSTHGFFFPEPKENYDEFVISQSNGEKNCRFSENPLLRSGLIMAGANFVWKGGEQIPGTDDGILSAYEVSNMNLSQTKLVVLSACETGLGDISGGEGVYGLQRAFKMAGVNYIIMSLWQVPDKETVEFMQIFYNNCINKNTIRESFAAAQATMRKKYSPYYWAAFVLVE